MKTFPKLMTLMLALVLVLTSAVACQGTPTVEPTTETSSSISTGATADSVIRMAVSGEPLLDPALATYWAAFYPYLNVYDALTKYDHNADLQPLLAESWQTSDDGMTWTFKLIEGAKFHDGSEVHASDVVFSVNRLFTIQSGLYYIFAGLVKNAEATDDYTVVFHLNRPDGVFDHRVSRLCVLNEDLIMANLDMNNASYNYGSEYGDYGITYLLSHDAGSGPYMATEVVSGNSLTTVQFADYHIPWSDKAPKTILYININVAATEGTMLASNELDISDNWQTNDIYSAWEKSISEIKIAKYSDYSVLMGFFNTQKAPTDDVYLRKAIASLVDYDTIIKSVLPYCALAYSPVPKSLPGASSRLTGVPYPYDLDQAAAYLAQSKYADTIGDYEIEVFIISGSTYQEQIGLMMQEAAKKIGINIKLTSAPFSTLIGRVGSMESTPDISIVSEAPNYNDPSDIFVSYFTKASQGSTVNMAWLNDDNYENMVAAASSIVDKTARYEAYADIEDYINDQVFAVWFAELTEQVAYRYQKINWPAAEDYFDAGELNYNIVSFHYWFPDWEIVQNGD